MITLCFGKDKDTDCPIKDKCLRYEENINVKKDDHFLKVPYKNGRCEHIIPILDVPLDTWDKIAARLNLDKCQRKEK